MSTRSQIKVKGSEIMIYKHSDGYPSEVMPTLTEVMTQFIVERGNEPDYALAQIMRAFARRDEKRRQEILNEYENQLDKWEGEEDEPEYEMLKMNKLIYEDHSMTGWGLDTVRHGDIEYLYLVDLELGVIVIYSGYGGSMEEDEIVSLRRNNNE